MFSKPKGIERLEKRVGLCEMLKEAHQRENPFYFDKDNEDCAGKLPLGMEQWPPFAESGQVGTKLGIFQDSRANSRIYQFLPELRRGTVNYVARKCNGFFHHTQMGGSYLLRDLIDYLMNYRERLRIHKKVS